MTNELYDVFISHASEDKVGFVRSLAIRLAEEHVEVWYDEFSLTLGDSLRQSIDRGLARSRFGIVVLSPSFFSKNWPQRELNGLVAREMIGGEKVILPIWHNVTAREVCRFSPPLADLLAVSSAAGIDEVVRQLLRTIRPQGSPLIIARDMLIDFGVQPPVVTDEWWLDVVEASNREPGYGMFSQRPSWGRWTFPLPDDSREPSDRGERLAWTAMQLAWEEAAELQSITQLTAPGEVLEFIRTQTGLLETCMNFPQFLASYAPQLTIEGFGGEFEEIFASLLSESMLRCKESQDRNDLSGSGLTTNAIHPACDDFIALRHPTFGNYEPVYVAGQFITGDLGGPNVKAYEVIDYLVWLLADDSEWLPQYIRQYLLDGVKEWAVWPWSRELTHLEREFGIVEYAGRGALQKQLYEQDEFQLDLSCLSDIRGRFNSTRDVLSLQNDTDELVARFLNDGFIQAFLDQRSKKK